jgi:hypothetical protein
MRGMREMRKITNIFDLLPPASCLLPPPPHPILNNTKLR